MKLKFTWPVGIVLALTAFVIFILSFVFRVVFNPVYDHHLVSENYYKDELHYQEEIDKLNNAAKLVENITIEKVEEQGLLIKFPSDIDYTKISGHIYFQRLNDEKIDFDLPIHLKSNQLLIDKSKLVIGQYNLKIDWKTPKEEYLYKKKIMY